MVRIILAKQDGKLAATDDESVAALARIKDGSEVYVEVTRGRNMKQHRLFFTLANIVAESMDSHVDVVREEALIRTGHAVAMLNPFTGMIELKAKSMKVVDGMSQGEFDAFMDKAVELMSTWIDADHKDLQLRYLELSADRRFEGHRRG